MKVKLILSVLLTMLSLSAFAQPEDAQLRRDLQAYYALADRLMASGNDAAALRLYHPGFVYVDQQGKRTDFAHTKSQFAAMRKSVRNARTKTVVKHVRRQGSDEAVAWAEWTFSGLVKQGSKWVPTKSTVRFAETLKRTGGGWKAFYTQELPVNEPWSFATGG